MRLNIFGRVCEVPRELPWDYVLKVERMLRQKEGISGADNIAMLQRLLSPEDYEYVTGHPEFKASYFWEIIAFGWLREEPGAEESAAFRREDDLPVEKAQAARPKKRQSARSFSGRTSRLTSSGSTASTCAKAT